MNVLKSPKLLIAGAILIVFAAGVVFEGYSKMGSTNAASTTTGVGEPAAASLVPSTAPAPNATRATQSIRSAPATVTPRKRSWEKEALIIGSSAGAGAAFGALSGGTAGVIYDMATRNK